jgi:hypothetical protein
MIEEINKDFYTELQARIASLAIGRSALRNQGASRMVQDARDFCMALDLSQLAKDWNAKRFHAYLSRQTRALMKKFRKRAQKNFGAARKALNLFFRDIVYNGILTKRHKLNLSKAYLNQLEVPLDSFTTRGIFRSFPAFRKQWEGIRYLKPTLNNQLQKRAAEIAKKNNIATVHLDVFYWRETV